MTTRESAARWTCDCDVAADVQYLGEAAAAALAGEAGGVAVLVGAVDHYIEKVKRERRAAL